MAQLVEHWAFNSQALGSNPSTLIVMIKQASLLFLSAFFGVKQKHSCFGIKVKNIFLEVTEVKRQLTQLEECFAYNEKASSSNLLLLKNKPEFYC